MREPLTLYHFTDRANLPSIRKHGLTPHPLLAFPGREREKAVWLNSEPKNAADCYGAIMLTVQVDLFDLRLCSDPDDDDLQPGWFIYRGVIPPDKITFP